MKPLLGKLLAATGLLGPARNARRFLVQYGLLPPPRQRAAVVAQGRQQGVEVLYDENLIRLRKGRREIRIHVAHEVYSSDMVNFFDYYHSAVLPLEIEGTAVVDYSRPRLHRLSRSGLEFEFPSLPESDESTEVYLAALAVQPGDTVLDLGAYAGASTVFLARAVGATGVVAAFEPDAASFQYLQANVTRHHVTNARLFKKGVWSETTALAFQAEGNMGSSAVAVLGRNSNVQTVEAVSLSDAAVLAGGARVAAIKMDIEGAEVAVLRSAGGFLRQHQPSLIIEPHSLNGRMNTDEVCHLLQSYGYSVELLSQGAQAWPLVAARPASLTPSP